MKENILLFRKTLIATVILILNFQFSIFNTIQAQTADNEAATITWALTTGTVTEAPACAPASMSQFIEKAEIVKGSGIGTPTAQTSEKGGITQTMFPVSTKTSSATDANAVKYLITLKDGIAFTPTKISYKAYRWKTNKGNFTSSWLCDGTATTLESGAHPNRGAGDGAGEVSSYSYDLSGTPSSEKQFGLSVSIYNFDVAADKGLSVGDLVIEGTLYGTVGKPLQYTLNVSVSPSGAGTVLAEPQGTMFDSGTEVTLSQQPAEGYTFIGWKTESGKTMTTADSYTFNIKGNAALTAEYVTTQSLQVNDYIIVGNKDEFRNAIKQVNANTSGRRQFIFLKNGDYDYGTFYNYESDKNNYDPSLRDTIKVDKVSIIGQKAKHVSHNPAPATTDTEKGVMIHILPVKEGISTTSPIVNRGTGTYLQDFTIENDYKYSGTARAGCWQDEGHHTIGKNMCLLSYQDTYYAHNDNGQFYWETSDLRGVVDFICGNGDVFINNCRLTNRDRSPYNTTPHEGGATLSAPYTQVEDFNQPGGHGFIFWGCTIDCESQTWDFGRGWRGWPKEAFINTVLTGQAALRIGADQTKGKQYDKALRVDKNSIQSCEKPLVFYEYNTRDEEGNINSPESNVLTFNGGSGNYANMTYETILKSDEIERFQLRNVYPDWAPDEECKQVAVTSVTREGNSLSWSVGDFAKAFLIEQDGDFVTIVDGTESVLDLSAFSLQPSAKLTVRAANMMGGFGPATEEGQSVTGIDGVKANGNANGNVNKVMEAGKLVIKKNGGRVNAAGQCLD